MTPGGGGGAIMAVTEMEDVVSSTEHVAQLVETYEPAPAPTAASHSPAPAYGVPRERRLWTAALAAALLIASGGLALLYVDDTNYQNADKSLTSQNESLRGRNQNLQAQLSVTEGKLTASQAQVTNLSTELQHPTLGVWNVPQTLHNGNEYLASNVPNTFTYHLKLTSSTPMSVSILSVHQFTQAVLCVYNRIGNTNYCMHNSGAVIGWLGVTSVNYDFRDAEGCAAYVAVITSAGAATITPNVSVTYNPASSTTGACA